mgnify:CR=1 FL=1
MKTPTSVSAVYPEKLAQKGIRLYDKIRSKLEKKYYGQYVAIDTESGKYFIGQTQEDVIKKTTGETSTGLYYFVKIGSPGVVTLSRHQQSPTYGSFF